MKLISIALATVASVALVACADTTEDTTTVDETMAADQMVNNDVTAGSIVEVAQGNADLSTLVAAVTSADLGETLSGEGPFTVFAPTNAAFEKVPQATRDTLMSEAGKANLSAILTYHVVAGRTDAAALTSAIGTAGDAGYTLTTVNGAALTAKIEDGNVVLTDAAGGKSMVTATDVPASNGIVHTIDTVLMPQ